MTVNLPHIAVIGKMGSGKTTVSDLLTTHFCYERLSFAEPLKVGCGTRDNRALLQAVGNGVRDLYADFWVNLFLAQLNELGSHKIKRHGDRAVGTPRRIVVDDCRYPNEAEVLRGEGFKFVYVYAPRDVRLARLQANGRLQDEAQLDHVSERSLDGFTEDATLVNDHGYLLDLKADLVAILNGWRS